MSLTIFSVASLITLHWINVFSLMVFLFVRTKGLQEWVLQDDAVS
jgi:hypothetical protein